MDLSGGPEGPIEHGFSNGVFVIPAVIVISLSGESVHNLYISACDVFRGGGVKVNKRIAGGVLCTQVRVSVYYGY